MLLEHTTDSFKSSVEDLALDELSRLEQTRKTLEADLFSVNSQIKSVRSVLQAVRPRVKKTKPVTSAPKKSASSFQKMSSARYADVTAWLKELGADEDVTASRIQKQFGWSSSYCTYTVAYLRDLGLLRLVGKQGSRMIYRSLVF